MYHCKLSPISKAKTTLSFKRQNFISSNRSKKRHPEKLHRVLWVRSRRRSRLSDWEMWKPAASNRPVRKTRHPEQLSMYVSKKRSSCISLHVTYHNICTRRFSACSYRTVQFSASFLCVSVYFALYMYTQTRLLSSACSEAASKAEGVSRSHPNLIRGGRDSSKLAILQILRIFNPWKHNVM